MIDRRQFFVRTAAAMVLAPSLAPSAAARIEFSHPPFGTDDPEIGVTLAQVKHIVALTTPGYPRHERWLPA